MRVSHLSQVYSCRARWVINRNEINSRKRVLLRIEDLLVWGRARWIICWTINDCFVQRFNVVRRVLIRTNFARVRNVIYRMYNRVWIAPSLILFIEYRAFSLTQLLYLYLLCVNLFSSLDIIFNCLLSARAIASLLKKILKYISDTLLISIQLKYTE